MRVKASGEFDGEGEPARIVSYKALVAAKATRAEILELMQHTDTVAEIQNTLRQSSPIALTECEAIEV